MCRHLYQNAKLFGFFTPLRLGSSSRHQDSEFAIERRELERMMGVVVLVLLMAVLSSVDAFKPTAGRRISNRSGTAGLTAEYIPEGKRPLCAFRAERTCKIDANCAFTTSFLPDLSPITHESRPHEAAMGCSEEEGGR